MLSFLLFQTRILFNLTNSRKELLIRIALLEKEVEILKRQKSQKKLRIKSKKSLP